MTENEGADRPSAAEQAAEAVPKPRARIVGGPARTETVQLQWPVEFDGATYAAVTITRPTVGALSDFLERRRQQEIDGTAPRTFRWPVYDVPDEVMDCLDPDDDDRVAEVAARFLPLRLRMAEDAARAESATQPSGGTSGGATQSP